MNTPRRPARRRLLQGLAAAAWSPRSGRAQATGAGPPALLARSGLWTLDPATLAPLRRLALAAPLVGEALALRPLAPALVASAGGRIARIDPTSLEVLAERDLGLQLRHAATSDDGRWLLVAAQGPERLLVFDARLALAREWPLRALDGRVGGGISLLREWPRRRSFVVALDALGEIWEISTDPKAEPVFDGLVHDFRLGEGLAAPGFLGLRRSRPDPPAGRWWADGTQSWLAGRAETPVGAVLTVLHLDVRRNLATLPVDGTAAPEAGAFFGVGTKSVFVLPDRQQASLGVVDTQKWQALPRLALPGPAAAVRAHPASRHAAVLCRGEAGTLDTVIGLDRETLQTAAVWRSAGAPLRALAHTPDGRRLLVLESGADAALQVLDAEDLRPLQRLRLS